MHVIRPVHVKETKTETSYYYISRYARMHIIRPVRQSTYYDELEANLDENKIRCNSRD